jgi:hypothetical protein
LISPSPVTTKTRVDAAHPEPHRPPDGDRQAVAERPGRGLDAGNLAGLGMAAEDRVAAAEGVEHVMREETLLGQHDILRDAAVPFRQDAAVALRPVRLGGAVAQDVVIEDAHDLDQRHRRADMPAGAAVERPHHQAP